MDECMNSKQKVWPGMEVVIYLLFPCFDICPLIQTDSFKKKYFAPPTEWWLEQIIVIQTKESVYTSTAATEEIKNKINFTLTVMSLIRKLM